MLPSARRSQLTVVSAVSFGRSDGAAAAAAPAGPRAAVLVVAAMSVAHSFFVTVWSRRREIGVLRAIGASRGNIRSLFLAEAALVGGVAGVVGAVSAVAMARLIDWFGRSWIPDFPYKPDSFFVLEPWMLAGAVVLAVAACVIGAAIPVFRTASKDPADALIDQ